MAGCPFPDTLESGCGMPGSGFPRVERRRASFRGGSPPAFPQYGRSGGIPPCAGPAGEAAFVKPFSGEGRARCRAMKKP